METKSSGILGEQVAKDYLIKKGYTIKKMNFTLPYGEIDIIAQKEKYIIFVEVKERTNDKFGTPIESITPYKISQIVRVAEKYMSFPENMNLYARFDVVTVRGDMVEEHIENAFTAADSNYKKRRW